jgi:hypothetical protein
VKKGGAHYATRLLTRERNGLEDQILASIQWAGRATVEGRNEEAFLLYAIAPESFFLAGGEPRELSYRLRLLAARFLGRDFEARHDVFEKVNAIYKLRSKIVHSGFIQVTQSEVGLIRRLTKATLIHICTSADLQAFSDSKELESWLLDQLLR